MFRNGRRENPYERYAGEKLILRDQLAIDRTILANERTFLSYCRTALALVVTGVGAIKLLNGISALIAGAALILAGILVMAGGAWHIRRVICPSRLKRQSAQQIFTPFIRVRYTGLQPKLFVSIALCGRSAASNCGI